MERQIDLYGVPMDLGASRRGVDMGPSALRIAEVVERIECLGRRVRDHGNIRCPGKETATIGDENARFGGAILECCEELARSVGRTVSEDHFPLVLGGDHSIAMGTVTGIARVHRERGEKIGLIWFDAHSDMNTPESSLSGNVHGMPLAMLLGFGPEAFSNLGGFAQKVDPANCALIGIRDVDRKEREIVRESGVHAFTMKEIDRLGMAEVVEQAIGLASDGTAGFHLSFDLDGLDPQVAPGVGTPVAGGISYREAHLMMELVADSDRLIGLEVVELNAVLDHRNATAEMAVELIQSALGRRIL